MGADATEPLFLGYGVATLLAVLWLVRRRTIREEDSPSWIGAAIVLILVGVVNIVEPEFWSAGDRSALEIVLVPLLILIGLHHTVRISRLSWEIKNLAQQIALLRSEVDSKAGEPRDDDN